MMMMENQNRSSLKVVPLRSSEGPESHSVSPVWVQMNLMKRPKLIEILTWFALGILALAVTIAMEVLVSSGMNVDSSGEQRMNGPLRQSESAKY
jgi:hypothetical protein